MAQVKFENVDCSTSSLIINKSNLRLISSSKLGAFLYRLLKENLDKSYEVTSSKFKHFDISDATISKMWTAVLPF